MTITRLSLPNPAKIRGTNFRLQRVQAMNPLRGGHHQAVDLGEPVWIVELETTPLSRERAGAWIGLLNKLRGALRSLLIHDAGRPRPIAYHSAANLSGWDWSSTADTMDATTATASETAAAMSGAAWGDPRVTAYDRTNGQITVEGLIAGAAISAGDYGAWDDGPTRRLVQVVDAAIANASGVAVLTVEPAPPTDASNLPQAFQMEKPCGEFVVTQWTAPYTAPVVHSVTLTAAQVLRRS